MEMVEAFQLQRKRLASRVQSKPRKVRIFTFVVFEAKEPAMRAKQPTKQAAFSLVAGFMARSV
jgi:hypothetical protein